MQSRVFQRPSYLSQGRHSLFLRPGHDLRSSLYPKGLRRRSASMLSWVKFIFSAGVSSSCDIVVMRGPSDGLSLMNTHSSKNAFFQGLTDWDLLYKLLILSVAFPFLWGYQVLVWHHCHQVIKSCSARQSRPMPFFPRGCTFSMVTTIACCPCHFGRVTSTLAVGRVAKFFQAMAAEALMLFNYALWFSPRGG